MSYFKNINLSNYRNFNKFSLSFHKGANIITGKNGSGKTNILEAISLFEKGKGLRKDKIINLINNQNNNSEFIINAILKKKKNEFNIKVYNTDNNLKKLLINDASEKDSIQHFRSIFSVIYFLPEMERLFLASPSIRRNFLDRLIFSSNKNYNTLINNYKKNIIERHLLLKNNSFDEDWLQNIESNIVKFGIDIYNKRNTHINKINQILKEINSTEHFANNFILKIKDEFLDNNNFLDNKELYISELKLRRTTDLFSGGCSIGPHRSDILGFNIINNFNLSQLSTGQQKTIVLLIIIAQSKYLIETIDLRPVILLDEVCSHLDDINRSLLLFLINELKIQSFLTGTEESFFSFLSTKANYCNIP